MMKYNSIMQATNKKQGILVFPQDSLNHIGEESTELQASQNSPVLFNQDTTIPNNSTNMQLFQTKHKQQRQIEHQPVIRTNLSTVVVVKPNNKRIYSQGQQQQIYVPRPPLLQANNKQADSNLVFQSSEWQQDNSPQSSLRKLYRPEQQKIKHDGQFLGLKSVQSVQYEKQEKQEKQYYIQQDSQDQQCQNQQDDVGEPRMKPGRKQVRSQTLFELVSFVIPQRKMTRCIVKSVDNGFFSLNGGYQLYLREQRKLLLRARKPHYRITSNFAVTTNQHTPKVIATVCSNVTRTEYKLMLRQEKQRIANALTQTIIRKGQTYQHSTKNSKKQQQGQFIQQQKCFVRYETNFLGLAQQKIELIKPKKSIAATQNFSNIKTAFSNCEYERILRFTNKQAVKNAQGHLFLDFKQKHIVASSRNTIIENEFAQHCIMLAKKDQEIFALDVMSPFSLLQAFFFAICNLDRKPLVH